MEQQTQGGYPVPLQNERWYSRAGRWTATALKKTGGVLKASVKPTLIVLAIGASCYSGFQGGRMYQSLEDGSMLEHTIMEEHEARSVVRRGNKLYVHEENSKTQAVDIDMIYEMMRKGSGPQMLEY
ncbi:hypothetical protein KY362_01560 [Candidatus Woesearchaeota archaeon]|nr:hypothetical protein [Candidatus Woesearchaeota archaeon]